MKKMAEMAEAEDTDKLLLLSKERRMVVRSQGTGKLQEVQAMSISEVDG